MSGFSTQSPVPTPLWDSASSGIVSSVVLGIISGFLLLTLFTSIYRQYPQIYCPRSIYPPIRSKPKRANRTTFAWLQPPLEFSLAKGWNWLKGPQFPWMQRKEEMEESLRLTGGPLPLFSSNRGRKSASVDEKSSNASSRKHRNSDPATSFLNDELLHLRTLALLLRIVSVWAVTGLLVGLPIYLTGLPRLRLTSNDVEGGSFSSIDDLSLVRLLRAFDLTTNGTSGVELGGLGSSLRLTILTVLGLAIPTLLGLWMIKREFDKVIENHRRFLFGFCEGIEIGWLGVNAWNNPWLLSWFGKKKSQLKNMPEERLRNLLIGCGLGPESDRERNKREGVAQNRDAWMARLPRPKSSDETPVPPDEGRDNDSDQAHAAQASSSSAYPERRRNRFHDLEKAYGNLADGRLVDGLVREVMVEGVYMVGPLDGLEKLSKTRRSVVDRLEKAEATYIASFRPVKQDEGIDSGVESSTDYLPPISKFFHASTAAKPSLPKTRFGSRATSKEHSGDSAAKTTLRDENSSRAHSPQIMHHGPTSHYSLQVSTSDRKGTGKSGRSKSSSIPLSHALRAEVFHGASFSEVSLQPHGPHSTDDVQNQWPIGTEVRVNELGRLEPVIPTNTLPPPGVRSSQSQMRSGLSALTNSNDHPLSEEPASLTADDTNTIRADQDLPSGELSGPPARASSERIPGLRGQSDPSPPPSAWATTLSGFVDRRDTTSTSSVLSLSSGVQDESGTDQEHDPLSLLSGTETEPDEESDAEVATVRGKERKNILPLPPSAPGLSDPLRAAAKAPGLVPLNDRNRGGNTLDRSGPEMPSLPRKKAVKIKSVGKIRSASGTPCSSTYPTTLHPQVHVSAVSQITQKELTELYTNIRKLRSQLRKLNKEIEEAQFEASADLFDGKIVTGWILVGKGVHLISGVEPIQGFAKEDILFDSLARPAYGSGGYWLGMAICATAVAVLITPAAALTVIGEPGVHAYFSFLNPISNKGGLAAGITTMVVPALIVIIVFGAGVLVAGQLARHSSSVSLVTTRLRLLHGVYAFSFFATVAWFIMVNAVIYGSQSIRQSLNISRSLADGAITSGTLFLNLFILLCFTLPAVLLLRIWRSWRTSRRLRHVKTPRQRFRLLRPPHFDPATTSSFLIFSLLAYSTFFLAMPVMGGPAFVLVLLSYLSGRYNVSQVFQRGSQTGGLYAISALRGLAVSLCTHPLFLGFILCSRHRFGLASACFAVSVLTVVIALGYSFWKGPRSFYPNRTMLSPAVTAGLRAFEDGARELDTNLAEDQLGLSRTDTIQSGMLGSSTMGGSGAIRRTRSYGSIFDMLNDPKPQRKPRPVPILTETVDEFDYGELAARTHEHQPPHLDKLEFTPDKDELRREMCYPPVLIERPPVLIFPNDILAKEEASDSKEFWGLDATYADALPLEYFPGLKSKR